MRGIDAVELLVFRRRRVLAGQDAQAIFLERDVVRALHVVEEIGKHRHVDGNAFRAAILPIVLEIESHQLATRLEIERMPRARQAIAEIDVPFDGASTLIGVQKIVEFGLLQVDLI